MEEFKLKPSLVSQLMRPVSTGRIVHAQIFSGAEGCGKSEAARYLAQALNCEARQNRPCGVCPSCLRFQDDNASELIEIYPEKGKKEIGIKVIRDTLLPEVALKPMGKVKCFIIHEAERLNDNAQNALLKTLEEAPEYAAFMLLTTDYTALLPTIRSRCTILRFPPLSTNEIEQSLGAGMREYACLSFGSIGRARRISTDEAYKASLNDIVRLFSNFSSQSDIPSMVSGLSVFKDKANILLETLEECAGELMRGRAETRLAKVLKQNGHDGVKLMKAVLGCRIKLDSNVNYQYAVEMMLFDILSPINI